MIGSSGSTLIDLGPLIQAGAHWVGVIILAALAAWLRSHLNDQAARETVLKAVANGISFAENHFGATSGKSYTLPMAQGIGATALRYVTELVPGAVKQLGLDDQALAKIVVAKMPGIDRSPLDPSTVDLITTAASGKSTGAAPSLDDLSKVLLPMIQQAVSTAVAAHYAVKPASSPSVQGGYQAPAGGEKPNPPTTGSGVAGSGA